MVWLVRTRAWYHLLFLKQVLTARNVQLLFYSSVKLMWLLNDGSNFGFLHNNILQRFQMVICRRSRPQLAYDFI